jgi:hypothetical membrane protein
MINPHRLVRPLLIGGILGPVQFTLVYLVEGATRPGYNAFQDAVSSLSLTDAGWVDSASLIVNGLLLMGFGLAALDVFRQKGWRWGPLLLLLAGFGITVAGVFPTDPSQGYPPGTPAGPAVVATLHGNIHSLVGAPATFGGLSACCAVFAWSFRNDPEWRAWSPYALITALAIVASFIGFVVSAFHSGPAGLFERIAFAAAFLWIVALAIRMLQRSAGERDLAARGGQA